MKMRVMYFIALGLFSLSASHAQVTNIPDPDFEQALIDLGIDTNATLDGQVPTANIDTIRELNVSGRNIGNLTGVEGFSSLTSLNCSSNRIATLDVSSNSELVTLICSSNHLVNLDLTANPYLTTLLCSSNELADLDITQNDSLTLLDCSDNQLTSLNVSMNEQLGNLNCSANQLTVLNIIQNDSLTLLSCSNNQLTGLDVSSNGILQSVICASNQLRALDVRANSALATLDFSHNLVRSQNLSTNTLLGSLNCSGNVLEYLNISNGNNGALNRLDARDNPLLSCITIDNVAETGPNWQKDDAASYATDCRPIETSIPDENFELALIALGLDTAPADGVVTTDSINALAVLDVSGQDIADLTGIEDFSGLTSLNCSNNQVTTLDLTTNAGLTDLNCSSNSLNSLNLKNNNNSLLVNLDARANPSLSCITVDDGFAPGGGWQKDAGTSYSFNCRIGETFVPDDQFEQALIDLGLDTGPPDNYVITADINTVINLDVSGKYISDLTGISDFTALESLNCSSNLLTSLNVSNNVSLTELSCFSNFLTALDITQNPALISLVCGDNKLDALDVTQNTDLETLTFDSNYITGLDISNNTNLVSLNCNSNKITQAGLDLTTAVNLERLFCSNNRLSGLDISQNTALVELDCSANKLSLLDLTENISIRKINASRNFLSILDLSTNADLDTLNCSANQLTDINLGSNPLLRMLVCNNNLLTAIDINSNNDLRFVSISSNELSLLNTGNNPMLVNLDCAENQLNALDVTNNGDLAHLAFSQNHLDNIDISQNAGLLSMEADGNKLATLVTDANTSLLSLSVANNELDLLDLTLNTALVQLDCSGNALISLDLTGNSDLTELACQHNAITHLDLSSLPALTSVNCASNKLTTLSIKNGQNNKLSVLNAMGNPDLLCIEVDDPTSIGSEWRKDDIASYNDNCHYEETYIPDDQFEAVLASVTGEPDNNDDYILTASISNLTSLNVSSSNIADLTGIQDFLALQTLDISNNVLDSIYLNDNRELSSLNASANRLQELDLTGNGLLTALDVSENALTSITLDALTSLSNFACNSNNIAELILTNNAALTSLSCTSNQLVLLKVDNGNNSSLVTFDARENPGLTCIEIDDESAIGVSWLKDDAASYSENCHYGETYIPDAAFEQVLIDFGYDYSMEGPLDNYVPTAKIDQVSILRISNKEIADLTGIEDFHALTRLDCSSNQLSDLDVSQNNKLVFLNCAGNQLHQIDISLNTKLAELDISGNGLVSLDISQNPDLLKLNCSSNQLTGLNILSNTNLREVDGRGNALVSVEANNGHNSILSIFDLQDNPALTCILVDDISAAQGYAGWLKDVSAHYKLECNDDDNDGVADADDLCPTTPFGDQVDLFGCTVFSLPFNNFTVLTTSESCRTGNNGRINIAAAEIHAYVAILTGPIDTVVYEFFDKVEIRNVRAGNYELCITIKDKADYEQCFRLVISEPENLKVISVGGVSGGRVAYQLSGNTSFIIEFNGLVFETEDEFVAFTLEQGRNTIRIKTGAGCQGFFEEVIYLSERTVLFPNPFDDYFHILPGGDRSGEVSLYVYTASGRLEIAERRAIINGRVELDVSSLPAGSYIVEMRADAYHYKTKAIKK